MKGLTTVRVIAALSLAWLIGAAMPAAAQDPLPSWNNGASKQAIVAFVERVTKDGSPDFVPVPQRIATFDNDGTLWSEQPLYFQLFFLIPKGLIDLHLKFICTNTIGIGA